MKVTITIEDKPGEDHVEFTAKFEPLLSKETARSVGDILKAISQRCEDIALGKVPA